MLTRQADFLILGEGAFYTININSISITAPGFLVFL